jgi:hypothetical protein
VLRIPQRVVRRTFDNSEAEGDLPPSPERSIAFKNNQLFAT